MNTYLKPKHQIVHLLIIVAIFGGLFSYQIISAQQPSSALLKKIKDDPGLPLITSTSLDAPAMITEALSREISSVDLRNLTGIDAGAASYFSFPEVKVLNTSGKVITIFSVILQIKNTGRFYGFQPSRLKLEPNESYVIKPNYWVSSQKVRVTTRTRSEGGQVEKVNRDLDFDSPEMWIPGRVSDVSLTIGGVTFSDGTDWKVKGKG
ncbi:MAG: hypothetical protein ACREBD_10120 [Blastocatellia bacterium]